ncbi:hypothetical protein MPSEU_000278400 [Mayamaea pseudoterrestris]|nr:hypothetical protein MPSEU_000278400 [Mayamaea pseudoterrestris]
MTDEFIDVASSPSSGTNLQFAQAFQQGSNIKYYSAAKDIIDFSDGEDDSSQAQRRRRRRQRKRQRALENHDETHSAARGKTDPNERGKSSSMTRKSPPHNEPSPRNMNCPPGLSIAEMAVLDIFPDICLEHLKTLLQQNSHQSDIVIMQLVDSPSYPKESSTTAIGSPLVKLDERKWSFDFMAKGTFVGTKWLHPLYADEARILIQNLLPILSLKALNNLLERNDYRYAICHDKIMTALKAGADDELQQYRRLDAFLLSGHLKSPDEQKPAIALLTGFGVHQAFIRNPRKQVPVNITDPVLLEEKRYVEWKWREYSENMQARLQRERHKMEADRAGAGIECICCFDTYAFKDMVYCQDKGHFCCCECLETFAKTKIWGEGTFGLDKTTKKPLLDLICFFGGDDGCTSSFDRKSLMKALDAKTLKKYDELQCQLVVGGVFGDDLHSCPKCSYKAAVPEGQMIFACPVEGCRFESCRGCGEAAHIPLRCDEVEKEVAAKGRLTVEEAISQAKIRRCPNARCKQPFLKSDGCNKVACSCGTFVCYICRKSIKDYTHFCQTPHCQHAGCNKCPLWTKGDDDDARAMREAGLQAASEYASTATGVNIDVDDILKAGVTKAKAAAQK